MTKYKINVKKKSTARQIKAIARYMRHLLTKVIARNIKIKNFSFYSSSNRKSGRESVVSKDN